MRPAFRARRPLRPRLPSQGLDRSRLPSPLDYYIDEGLFLNGAGLWRTALCPMHADGEPSLAINVVEGCFRCHSCGMHGGDVIAFHMQRHGLNFIEAARALGAWKTERPTEKNPRSST